MDICVRVEKVNNFFFFKMKVYNKTVIDWILGQQQFCLILELICCPLPAVYSPVMETSLILMNTFPSRY